MRSRFFSVIIGLLLVSALIVPAPLFAQQSKANDAPANNTTTPGGNRRTPSTRAATPTATRNNNNGARPPKAPATAESIEQDLTEALKAVQDNYVDGGSGLDLSTASKSSINGMLRSLDPHSNYFDRAAWEEFKTEQRSEYYGIGATIGDLTVGGEVETYIRATFQNSPAANAGLRYGDRIAEVNGKPMRGKPFYEVREQLRGPRATIVRVTVVRAATGKTETVEITRGAVPQPSIPESYMIRPGVGYVAMTGGFNLTTADEFESAMESLRGQGMQMLVLDLRGNGGGLLGQAVRVANTFLQNGQTILTQKGRIRGSTYRYVADNEAPDPTAVVVLVNRGSASASEIVAGALQDHDRALIVGETSFGKGLVQLPFEIEGGSALLLTIAKYYTPSGRLIQRDYEGEGLYDYVTGGGVGTRNNGNTTQQQPARPAGPESRTDTGRTVYGGGGITPDETVLPRILSPTQVRLNDPVFAFALELIKGNVKTFESYAATAQPIRYDYDLKATDFPVGDSLYASFKEFVASKPAFKFTPARLDRERAYIERRLRYELATAAYGYFTAFQVYNDDDPQIRRAVELLPRARELAQAARLARKQS